MFCDEEIRNNKHKTLMELMIPFSKEACLNIYFADIINSTEFTSKIC